MGQAMTIALGGGAIPVAGLGALLRVQGLVHGWRREEPTTTSQVRSKGESAPPSVLTAKSRWTWSCLWIGLPANIVVDADRIVVQGLALLGLRPGPLLAGSFEHGDSFMRAVTVLGLLAVLSCERTSLRSGVSPGDARAAGGFSETGSGGVGGSANNAIGGNCINEAFDAGPNSCSYSLPLPCEPCINCAPLPPGDDGGCAAPDISIFDWHGGGVDKSLRYPLGCVVYVPTQDPYYPGGPQTCSCITGLTTPTWVCGV